MLANCLFGDILRRSGGNFPIPTGWDFMACVPEEINRITDINTVTRWKALNKTFRSVAEQLEIPTPYTYIVSTGRSSFNGFLHREMGFIGLYGDPETDFPYYDVVYNHEFGHGLIAEGVDQRAAEFAADAFSGFTTNVEHAIESFHAQAELEAPAARLNVQSYLRQESGGYHPSLDERIGFVREFAATPSWQEFVRGRSLRSFMFEAVPFAHEWSR